jgi:hypothetical protein
MVWLEVFAFASEAGESAAPSCPPVGLFGHEDRTPSPKLVNQLEAALKKHGKRYEFYRYYGAGHGFFYWPRPLYRPEQAMDGWSRSSRPLRQAPGKVGGSDMCTPIIEIAGGAKTGTTPALDLTARLDIPFARLTPDDNSSPSYPSVPEKKSSIWNAFSRGMSR